MKAIFLILFSGFAILSCKRIIPCDIAIAVPVFTIGLVDQNLKDNPDSFKWYYQTGAGLKQDSFSILKITDTVPGQVTYRLEYDHAVGRSLESNKTFFLKRSASVMDTIYYDVKTSNEPCTIYTVEKFTYNGRDARNSDIVVK